MREFIASSHGRHACVQGSVEISHSKNTCERGLILIPIVKVFVCMGLGFRMVVMQMRDIDRLLVLLSFPMTVYLLPWHIIYLSSKITKIVDRY